MTYGITEEEVELMKGPRLSESFPIKFSNGEIREDLTMACPCCKQTIPDVLLKGRVFRPAPHVVVVKAGGYCDQCDQFTMSSARLYDDGRTTQYYARKWEEIEIATPSAWVRAKRFLLGNHSAI